MTLGGIELCCPQCRGDLSGPLEGEGYLTCARCARRYPVVLGIPDLRLKADPYIDPESDRAKGKKLAAKFDELSFAELVAYYYSITPAVPAVHAKQYTQGLLSAVPRAEAALADWSRLSGAPPPNTLLDVGCGTAPLLIAAASQVERVIGVDVAFRWLVVGKKRLLEAGLDLPLVCASAEALPFRDVQFDRVTADAVLEHLDDQPKALSEWHRVLKPGGWFFATTPNKNSLGPDPHTGLWAGTVLPQKLVSAYVRRLGGIPPKRQLLSARTLKQLIGRAGFKPVRVSIPDISDAQRAFVGRGLNLAVDLYHLGKRLPLLGNAFFLIGPHLRAVARK